MSKEEIEEAKERSKRILIAEKGNIKAPIFLDDLEVLLQALDNSIDKEVIRNKIKELKKHRDLSPFGTGKLEVLQELLEGK